MGKRGSEDSPDQAWRTSQVMDGSHWVGSVEKRQEWSQSHFIGGQQWACEWILPPSIVEGSGSQDEEPSAPDEDDGEAPPQPP